MTANLTAKWIPILSLATLCGTFGVLRPSAVRAQAPPAPAPQAGPAQPVSPQALAGSWALNRSQSDDPDSKMKGREEEIPFGGVNNPGSTGPYGGAGAPAPAGRRSNPRTPGAGPLGGPIGSVGSTDKDREKTLATVRPLDSFTLEPKDGEFDLTDDQGRKQIFVTDGRKLKKPSDEKAQELAGQWTNGRLVSDEKGPRNAKLTRTFELSRDGHQLYETIELDDSKVYSPLVTRYVYDPAPPRQQP